MIASGMIVSGMSASSMTDVRAAAAARFAVGCVLSAARIWIR